LFDIAQIDADTGIEKSGAIYAGRTINDARFAE
jgi:hypothetical protein